MVLQKATAYYKVISPILAKDFLLRIREAKKYITINLEGDDIMYNDIRIHNLYQVIISNTNYTNYHKFFKTNK